MAGKVANKGNVGQEGGSENRMPNSSDIVQMIRVQTDPITKELSEYKVKIIEVLGIFVALFTFVSVDFQIFKLETTLLSAVGVSLTVLGGLSLFVLLLFYAFNNTKPDVSQHKSIYIFLSALAVGLLMAGIIFVWHENQYLVMPKSTFDDKVENFYSKEEVDILLGERASSLELKTFKDCLKSGQWNNCFK